jgi:predicted metal-dependent HD superfamily phosphohydrolase
MGLVSEFILCTIDHDVTSPFLLAHQKAYEDARVFLDLDLSILGTDEATFDAYDDAIRKEYEHVNNVTFAQGRVHVLKSLACRTRIFQSAHFSYMEEQARKNLERAVRKWELRQ